MSDLKIQHILTLTQLLSKGARYNFVQVTSSSLGKSIKKSQQAASTVSYTHIRAHETLR